MKKNKKKKMFTKVERFLYKSSLVIIVFLVIGTIFGQTMLSKVNYEVEKLKNNLDEQKETNQSLVMVINEMISLENIQTIAESMGLAYNNDNIKTITE
ncbi:MAG: hypothetical protein ACI4VR_00905 [Bacilli bacterium]